MSASGSRKQDFQSLNTNRKNLVSYEDLREIFVSRKEFVFPMGTCLDQAANKGSVDGNFVTKNCATFSGDVDITNKKIVNVAISTSNKYAVNKLYVDTNTVKLSSFTNVISKFTTDW